MQIRNIIAVLVLSVAAFAQGGFYQDRAEGRLINGNALVAIPGAAVTVCSDQACVSPVNIYSNADLAIGHLIGTSTTADANGNFSFYVLPGQYFCQVAASGFSTAINPCQVSGANVLTAYNLDNILFVDGVKYATCDAAVAALGSNIGIVIKPSTYVGAACSSVPANVTVWDFTGGDPSTLNTCAWNSTSGSGLHSMLRCTQTRTSPTSSDLVGYFVNIVTGTLPSNQAIDVISPELNIIGSVNSPTNTAFQDSENAVIVQSTGGNLPFVRGGIGYANTTNGSTTTISEVDGYEGKGCNLILGSGAISKCYGLVGDNQTSGTGENYSMFGRGDWKALNGHAFDVTDNGGVIRHLTQWRSDNTIQYFPLVDGATGWRWSRQDAGADYLLINATDGVKVPGNFQTGGHISQVATKDFAGTCTMAAGTSCTFTLVSAAYSSTPVCIANPQGTTAIAGACSVSSTTVTITAASSNSQTWGAMLIGNPN